MENKENSKPKKSRPRSQRKGGPVSHERKEIPTRDTVQTNTPQESTLSSASIHAVVDAIAEDARFTDAFHILQNILMEFTKTSRAVDSDPIPLDSNCDDTAEKERLISRLEAAEKRVAELEALVTDKHAQIEQLQDHLAQREEQIENFQQQLMKRNMFINSISKERDDIAAELQSKERNFDTMENALNGISASILGAISQPFTELELRLATAYQRKNPLKTDLRALMTAVCSLRSALEDIDIGGGYGVEIGACVDEEVWLKQVSIPFDDNLHARGETGQQVVVRTRGFRYVDALGEDKTIKADVIPVDQPEDLNPEVQASEVSTIE